VTAENGGVLSIKDVIEIVAIFIVGAGVIGAIRHDQPNPSVGQSSPELPSHNETDGNANTGGIVSDKGESNLLPSPQHQKKGNAVEKITLGCCLRVGVLRYLQRTASDCCLRGE
jgi:hypothetical protein